MSDLTHRICDIIWSELHGQFEGDPFGPYVNRKDGVIDGHVNMSLVAEALVRELPLNSEIATVPVRVDEEELMDVVVPDGKTIHKWHSEWTSFIRYVTLYIDDRGRTVEQAREDGKWKDEA